MSPQCALHRGVSPPSQDVFKKSLIICIPGALPFERKSGGIGPGWKSPAEAIKRAKREKLLYIVCIQLDPTKPDYLATIDIDPCSPCYSEVIHRLPMPNIGDEVHHMGWNTCSSCYNDCSKTRDKLILPCLKSSRIYVVDTSNPIAPEIHKIVEGTELAKEGVSQPHTAHCLPDNTVMISTMGDSKGNGLGDFVLIDGETWTVKGLWTQGEERPPHGYDFWYQPYWDIMIASEFSTPRSWLKGCDLEVMTDKVLTGHSLNFYSWKEKKLINRIDLGEDGITPLEVRFLHDPKATQGYVGCAFSSTVFRFFRNCDGSWSTEKVITMPKIKANGWVLPAIPGMVTDILISMDDRWLYVSNWLHGDLRQYDISTPENPKLVSSIQLGGLLTQEGLVDPQDAKEPLIMKGVKVQGGPQMMQLSIDGQRLYISTSLYSAWDKQFYPELGTKGGALLKIDVDNVNGGMCLDESFFVDFGTEPEGPVLAHECRYPGGDCSSDIFLAED